jgi:branched-chain amino acid transport system permease protein
LVSITAEALASQLVNGLVLGMLYVLLAVGLSLIFGMIGVINFAHGVMFTLGAYLAYTARDVQGFWPAVLVAALIAGCVGAAIEFGLLRRLYSRDPLNGFLMTFGLALLMEDLIRAIWGAAGVPFALPEALGGLVLWGPIVQTKYRLVVLLVAASMVFLLWLALEKTRLGMVIRAGSRDPVMVQMLGTNIKRVFTLIFGVGSALAAIAGVLAAPLWGLQPGLGTSAIMPSFVVVAIGGLGSIRGAVMAGLLVGEVISLSITFYPPMSEVAMYILMTLVLLLRPRGLFGEEWERFE